MSVDTHTSDDRVTVAMLEAKAEAASCLEFMSNALSWENFRIECLYFDDKDAERRTASERNADILRKRLTRTGHGIAFLREYLDLKRERDEAVNLLREMWAHRPGCLILGRGDRSCAQCERFELLMSRERERDDLLHREAAEKRKDANATS